MKPINLKRELPEIGDCTIRVSDLGVTVKRGRREVVLTWDAFWRTAMTPMNAPAKAAGTAEGKRGWVREGRK